MSDYNPGVTTCAACATKGDVVDSRPSAKDGFLYRRRRCPGCGVSWRTVEVPAEMGDRIWAIVARAERLTERIKGDASTLSDAMTDLNKRFRQVLSKVGNS